MRKLGATLLALPVVTVLYLAAAIRSIGRLRAGALLGAVGLIALIVLVSARPAPSAAVPPAPARTVDARLLDAVVTGHSLRTPFTLGFDAPMDAASVAGALRISPDAGVTFTWDPAGRTLVLTPATGWAPDTLYAIVVDQSARARDGSTLASPVRALVLTARAGSGSLSATRPAGARIALDTAFAIHLDRPVALSSVEAALRTEPAIAGAVTAGAAGGEYLFTPTAPLAPDTAYRLSVAGLADDEGTAFAGVSPLVARTIPAPGVVRFRPLAGSRDVAPTTALSVRFTLPMDHASTESAFRVTAAGKRVSGKVAWAENSTVLVFTPAGALPDGASVTMELSAGATSADGAPVLKPSAGTFSVKAKPVPKPTPKPAPKPAPSPGGSGGSGGATASWYSVETYYLGLMNCTRTGGWVTSSGSCSSPGGRDVAPLALSAGISTKVTRPYAKLLATGDLCNHFYDGNPGDRLARAGYKSYNWGENIGCMNLSPKSAVLSDHLFFQSEKPTNGGHYRNLMNALYTQVGIGVWVSSGRVRLVIDFYRP